MKQQSTLDITPGALDALEARFAHRVAARLSEGAQAPGPDVSERLRFAREQALERARAARATVAEPAPVLVGHRGVVAFGGGWWVKVASVLPLVALAAGLFLIEHLHTEAQISSAAEIDAELLSDDLPPGAYTDAGFAEFLKSPPRE